MAGSFPKGPFKDVPNIQGGIAAIKCPCDPTHYLRVKVNSAGWPHAICSYQRCGVDLKTQGMSGAAWLLGMVEAGNWEKGAKSAALEIINPKKPEPAPAPVPEPAPPPTAKKSLLATLFED